MTTYTLRKASPDRTRTDVVVIGVATNPKGTRVVCPGGEPVADVYGRRFDPMLASLGFGAKPGEVLRIPAAEAISAAHLVVVGLGDLADLTPEAVRRAAGAAARGLQNAASVAFALPTPDADHVRAVTDGVISGLYRYAGHKSAAPPAQVADVVILCDTPRRVDVIAAFEEAQVVGAVTATARDWVNTPPNLLVPEEFAARVKAATKGRRGVRYQLLDAAALRELGCGGILAVGDGSANPPCLVKLTWKPRDARGSVALVGKGITYDSGGLSIKPASSMTAMKNDMAGAAAVVAAIHAIAELEIPVAVTAYVPMAENMLSGTSMRPGDVLTMLSGKTVEVLNTDAEGRLILADALTMAVRDEPDVILDVATLTGPCVVALGEKIAGLFGDDDIVTEVEATATRTGELFWHLPIPEESRISVRTESKVADLLQHNFVRWGSASYAAAFLEQFVEGRPWAHFDVAGPAYNTGAPWGHVPSGGTGFAVATLVELVRGRA